MCCSFDDLLSFCSTALGNESRGINIKQAKSKSKEDDFIKHGHGNYNKMHKYGDDDTRQELAPLDHRSSYLR
jgi:hypothetical protein